ncbi:MAG: hypothetical protein V4722_26425 [Bacteroidota bacterium]
MKHAQISLKPPNTVIVCIKTEFFFLSMLVHPTACTAVFFCPACQHLYLKKQQNKKTISARLPWTMIVQIPRVDLSQLLLEAGAPKTALG